jgi:hypothetical protein
MKKKRLGEALHERGKITAADLEKVIAEQQGKLIHLGELLLDRGIVAKTDLASALEDTSGTPYLDCAEVTPTPEALRLIPQAMAERLLALPIRIEQERLVVAMASPQNLAALDELRFKSGREISPRQSFRSEIQAAIAHSYGGDSSNSASSPSRIRKRSRKCRRTCGSARRRR